jgi:hypothetical protein
MKHRDLVDIELILIEAHAYSLRNEVKLYADKLILKYNALMKKDAYSIAFKKTITELDI